LIDNYSSFAKYWPSRYEPILPQTKFKLIEIVLHHSPFDHQNTIEWISTVTARLPLMVHANYPVC